MYLFFELCVIYVIYEEECSKFCKLESITIFIASNIKSRLKSKIENSVVSLFHEFSNFSLNIRHSETFNILQQIFLNVASKTIFIYFIICYTYTFLIYSNRDNK